jgi:hypothetical protein
MFLLPLGAVRTKPALERRREHDVVTLERVGSGRWGAGCDAMDIDAPARG